jgi:hypothetical protein
MIIGGGESDNWLRMLSKFLVSSSLNPSRFAVNHALRSLNMFRASMLSSCFISSTMIWRLVLMKGIFLTDGGRTEEMIYIKKG